MVKRHADPLSLVNILPNRHADAACLFGVGGITIQRIQEIAEELCVNSEHEEKEH
ncbi:hypothetical protein [Bacillus sp. LL01]|uniref:hypothetical protein n=1 Tax=Bacillus sp. LL01 TaxID=1665556 RepID=UPI000A7D6E9D|nr:hypothetical protein [Bacillus sp. LL01]